MRPPCLAVFRMLAAMAASCGAAKAQEPPVLEIAQINHLLRTPAGTTTRAVFRGVVNHRSAQLGGVFIQDASAGVFVWTPKGVENPALGAEIEVTADVRFSNTSIDTEVRALSLRVIGQPGVSAAVEAAMPDITAGNYNRLAVQIEATVLQAQEGQGGYRGIKWLVLANATGACMGGIYSWPAGWKADSLEGKTVRFRGVSAGSGAWSLRCSSPDEVTVLNAASAPPAVLASVQEVLDLGAGPARTERRPLTLRGVCAFPAPNRTSFTLHDGSAGVVVLVSHPELCPQSGDEVRLSGVTTGNAQTVYAEAWAVQRTALGRPPQPPAADAFAGPRRTVREILASPVSPDRFVMSGVVVFLNNELLAVQDATGTAFVSPPQILPMVAAFLINGKPKPGDRIEVSGIRGSLRELSPEVYQAMWRVTGPGELPGPKLMTMSEALTPESDGKVIRVRGRVVDYETFRTRTGKVSRLWVRAGDSVTYGNVVAAEHEPQPAATGTLVELEGFCLVSRVSPNVIRNFALQMNSMKNVRIVPEPFSWEKAGALRVALISGGVLLVAGAWIFFLRRQVRLRTATIAAREAELRVALAREQELGQLKTSFVSLVSHEFRTPLNVIVTSADILSRYLERLPDDERAEHLDSIQNSVKRMSGMMEDVLLLGRFESGMQKFQPEELHLTAWCRRFVDEMQSATCARCPIELTAGDFDPVVRADESLLRHILANLISNAAKYSDAGATVKLSVAREGRDAVFRVEDHGIGIPGADRVRLFEAFQRGSNVGHIAGTGLGLVVVKRGVEMHGGSVDFTSEEGRGTRFTVRLPLFAAAAADESSIVNQKS